ncbi:alpha/beta hydrolase [Chondromyces crocatus]|nr:alpha/beta hydrolase-fold protein [Chondromyces crocatus]
MVRRRQVLTSLAALAWTGCRGGSSRADDRTIEVDTRWRELRFEAGAANGEAQRALLLVPDGAPRRPVLVALHGRGEAVRGLDAGARGWRDDYHLDRLLRRLQAPPLTSDDLGGLVAPERLIQMNASLQRAPFEGMVIVTPYTPDNRDRSLAASRGFARFLVEQLLPRVRTETGNGMGRQATGIDGVSLGGRLALQVGLSHPEMFGAVAALQPALQLGEAVAFADLAHAAVQKAPLALRLVSSERDPFLPAVRALSEKLDERGVAHEFHVTPGPHDYAWNRGPGGAEMALWHERVQRGLPPP